MSRNSGDAALCAYLDGAPVSIEALYALDAGGGTPEVYDALVAYGTRSGADRSADTRDARLALYIVAMKVGVRVGRCEAAWLDEPVPPATAEDNERTWYHAELRRGWLARAARMANAGPVADGQVRRIQQWLERVADSVGTDALFRRFIDEQLRAQTDGAWLEAAAGDDDVWDVLRGQIGPDLFSEAVGEAMVYIKPVVERAAGGMQFAIACALVCIADVQAATYGKWNLRYHLWRDAPPDPEPHSLVLLPDSRLACVSPRREYVTGESIYAVIDVWARMLPPHMCTLTAAEETPPLSADRMDMALFDSA